ncbi:MAG: extensin family protein [Deltaproteobacteria bacterium]|nr:extensin family protein [Deltaproteobacteria bacterium]
MSTKMCTFRVISFLAGALATSQAMIPARASGQNTPGVETLRARLAELKDKHERDIPQGAFDSVAYNIDVAERIDGRFTPQAQAWRGRAAALLDRLAQGADPFPEQRGKILMRGYRSPISIFLQGYAIYIPPDYDSTRAYPLMVVMHGGSANGNLFLGVVLGNNMSWLKYSAHLWDVFEPRWSPDWIVVAPDGFGQVMWRWMGERDVLDVIDDVEKHYNVDVDRVVLGGLSNGGVGAYSIGLRHAWRFSVVTAMAGAPSWVQYAGGEKRMNSLELFGMQPLSGLALAENAFNTDFRYFHGRTDTGPMKPWFVEQFSAEIKRLGVPHHETWYDTGHDILYLVHRHGAIYDRLAEVRRNRKQKEIRLVAGDYRANRQHWLSLTRLERYPKLGRLRATVDQKTITVETSNALAFSLDLRDVPLERAAQTKESEQIRIVVDGSEVYKGPQQPLGHVAHISKQGRGWRLGFLPTDPKRIEKQPGVSGPITDAYFDAMVHVYGTSNQSHTEALKRAATRGAQGWPLWLWRYDQKVVSDQEVTEELMQNNHLVLYGTPGDNLLLERIQNELPIRVVADGVMLGKKRLTGEKVGVKFIYPNPLATKRYIIVQAGVSTDAVSAGHNLPDFLPDYVVYDKRTTATRPRLLFNRAGQPLAQGYFDRYWRLPEKSSDQKLQDPGAVSSNEAQQGSDGTNKGESKVSDAPEYGSADAGFESLLPIPPAPPEPPRPRRFAAPKSDPAGEAARIIASRVRRFGRFRANTPGGTWIVDPFASWKILPQERCLRTMQKEGVAGTLYQTPLTTPVPTPVEIEGPVKGVHFKIMHDDRTLLISCELAIRLPVIAAVLKRHGVTGVQVMSAYRDRPIISFHSLGLALDIMGFVTPKGVLSVLDDFVITPDYRTCEAPKHISRNAQILREIACDIADTHKFSTILTPNYNIGHRDHMHIDVRPDDPRIFVR